MPAGTNIANWFAYYHTRILSAKTGITLVFSNLDKNYRVGFGSINGKNTSAIPESPTPYTYWSPNDASNKIAAVSPFGDGSSGTQKANFWNWITTITPSGGTPLRSALKAVGEYYKTDQPWQTSATDKTELTCRPAFTILTTDGFWNTDSDSSIGLGNVDGNNGPKITAPATYQRIAAQPYSDSYSNTLADVAMQYWQNDLRPNAANNVPTTPSDPAFWQHMTTFTMGLGFTPTGITPSSLTPPQLFEWARTGTPPAGVTSMTWPQPQADSINNIADLLHAAINGHGDFFSAKNPAEFISGLKSALAQIADRKGAGNAITLSGTSTSSSSDAVYRFVGTYYTGQWSGELTAEKWDNTAQAYVPAWKANNAFPSAANRNIWTMSRLASALATQTPTAFVLGSGNTLPNLDAALLQGLDYYVNGSKQSTTRAAMLNYLRGDNSDTTLRQRKVPLGDVISSTPVYVAAPDKTLYVNATFDGASTYGTFVANQSTRNPLVYVAANDGMLHAFRVKQALKTDGSPDPDKPAGQEVFAYLPAAVLAQAANSAGGISNLANPQYGVVDGVTGAQAVPHQYYNDGKITTQNVYLDTGDGQGKIWRTILVGTTGRGPAMSVYALDITNPANFDALARSATDPTKPRPKVLLWERSAGDTGACSGTVAVNCSDYIGQMTGAPVIAQIKDGTRTKWVAFVGNGYNSNANRPALLEFDLATGALKVRPTLTGALDDGLAEPGLAQPDSKTGISTAAYAGDLNGNLWKFDLTSPIETGTTVFKAVDKNGNPQPITSLVALIYDSTRGKESTWALFGTGRYLSDADIPSTQVQTWYGVRVDAATSSALIPLVTASTKRSDMVQRSILKEDSAGNGNLLRATSPAATNDMDGKAGWYMDLSTQSGERILNRTQFIGGLALVTTMIPKVSDPCNTVPSGAVMLVDPFTGANLTTDFGLGQTTYKPNNGTAFNVAYNGVVYPVGPAGGVTGSYDNKGKIMLQFNNLSGSPVNLGPITSPSASVGRVSWREVGF
ncbi:MAG: pilus assembly protein [Thiomonas sp.]